MPKAFGVPQMGDAPAISCCVAAKQGSAESEFILPNRAGRRVAIKLRRSNARGQFCTMDLPSPAIILQTVRRARKDYPSDCEAEMIAFLHICSSPLQGCFMGQSSCRS
jgi:hypothetical protein